MRTHADVRAEHGRGGAVRRLSFIDHDRRCDATRASAALPDPEGPDLGALPTSVAGHAEMSRRLLALGVRDRSDTALDGRPEAG